MKRLLSATLLFVLLPLVCAHAVDRKIVIRNFNPNRDGSYPTGGLRLNQGNFYGATLSGNIFELTPNGSGGWTYNLLFNTGNFTYSQGYLVMDEAGNLYTSTFFGDVIEYSPNGSGGWTGTTVYSFNVSDEGPSPVILDAQGNLYGTFASGGSHGRGFVFELSPSSSGPWTLIDLHDFNGRDGAETTDNDAGGLLGGLIFDAAGNLYGTIGAGGTGVQCPSGCGVVFELKHESARWVESVLHNFNGTDGMNPEAALLMDGSGNLYGTTTAGGTIGFGVVFETSPVAGGWQTSVLHNFTNTQGDGAFPQSPLIMDDSGTLYGTTASGGGSSNCTVVIDNGCGTAFELSENNGMWQETILHDFTAEVDGGFPGGVVLLDEKLYGVAEVGGHFDVGVFFKIEP